MKSDLAQPETVAFAVRDSSPNSNGASDPRVFAAVESYLRLCEAGTPPNIEAFVSENAEIAAELRACLAGLAFLQKAAPNIELSSAAVMASATMDQVGHEPLGDYRLIRELGRGGMGIVYEAEQLSLSRRVALKILPFAAVLDPRHLQRFKNEALAAAHLAHPHIVDVYGIGCERSIHFYAMRLIEGQTLAAVIDALRLADAGTASHSSRLAPRDEPAASGRVSPRRDPESSPRRIFDRRDSATCSLNPELSLPAAAGTLNPATETVAAALFTLRTTKPREFFRHVAELGVQAAEALDHAHQMGIVHRDIKPSNLMIDNFGKLWITDFGLARFQNDAGMTMTGDLLGTLRYMSPEQALAKRIVVDHRTDIYSLGVTLYELLTHRPAFEGADREAVLRKIAFDEPVAPRKLNSAIPLDLETIVTKAIAKNPNDRYATARELADDVQRLIDQKPIKAKPPNVWQRANKLFRRHQAIAASAFLVLLLATLGLTISTLLISNERSAAVAASENAENERNRAEANYSTAREAVKQRLTRVANEKLEAIREMKDLRRQLLSDAAEFYTTLIDLNPTDARVHAERAEVAYILDNWDSAIKDYETASELEPENIQYHIRLAELYRWGVGHGVGDDNKSIDHAEKALAIDPRHEFSRSYYLSQLTRQGRIPEARELLESFKRDAALTSSNCQKLAWAYMQINDREIALQYALQATQLDPQDHGAYDCLGGIYFDLGRIKDSLEAYDKAFLIKPYGIRTSRPGRGDCLVLLGRYSEAVDQYDREIEQRPNQPFTLKRRAAAHFYLGNFEQALSDVRKVLSLNPGDLSTLFWVGHVKVAQCPDSNYRNAILELLNAQIDHNPRAFHDRAILYALMGRTKEAWSDIERVRAQVESIEQQHPSLSARAQLEFSDFLARIGAGLLEINRTEMLEPVLSECLAIRKRNEPDGWRTYSAMSMFGGLWGMERRRSTLPPQGMTRLQEAAERLVRFYRVTGDPEKQREWQYVLDTVTVTTPISTHRVENVILGTNMTNTSRSQGPDRPGSFGEAALRIKNRKTDK
jgi:serine/threonine protein kinase/Tfp pilus assembly protein PilF